MSRESWIAEFYPIPAEDTTPEQAIDHSILKWTGLQPENLQRHEVLNVRGATPITVSDSTCALCVHFYSEPWYDEDFAVDKKCRECPLAISLGSPCDVGADNPWSEWIRARNARPMLDALLLTKKNGPPPTDQGGNTKEQK